MAIKVTLKNSVVQNSVPTTTHLAAVGELALNANINSLGIYMRASDNSIVKMAGPGSLTTPAASTTAAGIAELATSAETTTGTDAARVTTPAGVKAVTDAERTTSNNTYLALAGGTLTGVLAATAGSNSAASIHFGDTDSGLFGGTNTVSLTAGGTTRLTADTGVSVVGTLAVTGAITSTSDLTIADKVIHSGDTDTAIRFPAANTVSVESGGSEALRVDSSQRLLVGLTSARAIANLTTLQQIEGTDAASGLSITRNSASNEGGTLNFGKSRAAGLGGVTVIQDGDALGTINFSGADGTDLTNTAASIAGFINGTPGANDTPGKLVFGTTADGAATPTTRLTIDSAGVVNVPDNGKFTAGASSDLSIFHDGSNSYLKDSGTGALIVTTSNLQVNNPANDENLIWAGENGAVELYYDNSKKFETNSAGVKVTGQLEADELYLRDSEKAYFGTGTDLQIYHDGSNSFLDDSGTGNLVVRSSTIAFENAPGGGESLAKFIGNGAVELYYDNSKKLYTESSGVAIDGDLSIESNGYIRVRSTGDNSSTAIQLGNDGTASFTGVVSPSSHVDMPDNAIIKLGTGDDLQIYHDGSNSYLKNAGTGNIIFNSDDVQFKSDGGGNTGLTINTDGAVELYYDNSKKLSTETYGLSTNITNALRWIEDSNAASRSWQLIGEDGDYGQFELLCNDSDGGTIDKTAIKAISGGAVSLYHAGGKKLRTTNVGVQVLGAEGGDAWLELYADEGDDNADKWGIKATHVGNEFAIQNYSLGSWQTVFRGTDGRAAELHYQGTKKLETTSAGVNFEGNGSDYIIVDIHNTGSGVGSQMRFRNDHAGSPYIGIANDTSGDFNIYSEGHIKVKHGGDLAITSAQNGAVELYYDNVKRFETKNYGVIVTGTCEVSADTANNYALQTINDGNSSNRFGVFVRCGADNAAGTNYAMTIADGDSTVQGYVTFTGGTVTYGTFTAQHPCIIPDADNPSDASMAYPYGTLLETISIEYTQKNGSNTERGIRYKVQKTQSANSRKVLGAYGSSMNGGPEGKTNEHQALVLGDGHILVNNAGGNIEVGDGICSSATAGIGQKATANPSMIIGIAQEAITFTGTETKLVAVQYGLQQFTPWT